MIDVLKEAVLRTGCLDRVLSVARRSDLDRQALIERLLLTVYAYGINAGIRSVAAGEHGHSEDDLRYIRRRYLTTEVAGTIAIEIANATFAARDYDVWGTGSSAVASDSTHVGAFDQNIFTEWHFRYRGRGVLIYWHVERKSMAIHSQLISCSASEVAAMIEGTMRHGTAMEVEGNYVDSHGQSEVGFGITRLLGLDLLPRIKRINVVKLYRPDAGVPDAYPRLLPAMNRPIRWDLIAAQYELTIERTKDGLVASRARGRSGGREPSLKPAAVRQAQEMYDSTQYTVAQIAAAFKTTRPTIYRALDKVRRASVSAP